MIIVKKYISYSKDKSIKIISSSEFDVLNDNTINAETDEIVKLNSKFIENNQNDDIRLAYICNWNQQCGISTYSKYVFDDLKELVTDYKIFSEYSFKPGNESDYIIYCWRRGEQLNGLLKEIKNYQPNVILLQHEWGIFSKAGIFMSFITEIKKLGIPIIAVLHSVYDHLDKRVPLSVLDNIIVHSNEAKLSLEKHFKGNVFVIPHGCPETKEYQEIWNIFQIPYVIFGFGFGFKYKGIDTAIDAIKYLKDTDSKFKDILYIYVCSESDTNKGVHDNYYTMLSEKVEKEGLEDNIILIRGYLEDDMLDTYLKTVKMVIFPYIQDSTNSVFGASGAIKIAMSYNIPIIASKSHMFDDIEGYVPRATDYKELAEEIDKIFSDSKYKQKVIDDAHTYITNNTWKITAQRYLDVINKVK